MHMQHILYLQGN